MSATKSLLTHLTSRTLLLLSSGQPPRSLQTTQARVSAEEGPPLPRLGFAFASSPHPELGSSRQWHRGGRDGKDTLPRAKGKQQSQERKTEALEPIRREPVSFSILTSGAGGIGVKSGQTGNCGSLSGLLIGQGGKNEPPSHLQQGKQAQTQDGSRAVRL